MNRADMLARLRATPDAWDVIVIGGGATGLGVALEAVARGHRTALLEQGDFTQATSSRSTKLIHGGLRYLQQGRLSLVKEALRERGSLLRNAPHIVRPLGFILPVCARWERPFYLAGLKLYDWLAGDSGLGRSQTLSRTATLDRLPTLRADGLRGSLLYHDAQFDDARLGITLARTVADLNGVLVNYVGVVRLLKSNGRGIGVIAQNRESGEEFNLSARVVINATGAFTDAIRRLDDPAARELLAVSQGAHLVLDKSFLPGKYALIAPRIPDGRVFFAIPWHDRVLIGTTETPVAKVEIEPRPLQMEVEFLLRQAGQHLIHAPGSNDILSMFAGLRPLVRRSNARSVSTLPRSHLIEVSAGGLVTITGGKWTTYRQMAEDTVNRAEVVAGLSPRPSTTAQLHLHAWCERASPEAEFGGYGADADALRAMCQAIPDGRTRLHPRLPGCVGEVLWAVRHEMARTVEDVLARRTRALFLDARASMEAAPRVAKLMASALERGHNWEAQQVAAFTKLAQGYLIT